MLSINIPVGLNIYKGICVNFFQGSKSSYCIGLPKFQEKTPNLTRIDEMIFKYIQNNFFILKY